LNIIQKLFRPRINRLIEIQLFSNSVSNTFNVLLDTLGRLRQVIANLFSAFWSRLGLFILLE
jgi:hypothetical protein